MSEHALTELERAALLALDTLLFIDDVMPTRKTARVVEVLAAALGDLATVVDVGSLITSPTPAPARAESPPAESPLITETLGQVLTAPDKIPGLLRDLETAITRLLQRGVLTSLQDREAASRLYEFARRIETAGGFFGVLSPDLERKIHDPLRSTDA